MKKEISYLERASALSKFIEFCHMHLFDPQNKQVQNYLLNKRKLSVDTIKEFQIGVFPRYANVISSLLDSFTAWQCGLIRFSEDGSIVSKFNTNNVIIPIYDQNNYPIAVIGRTMLPDEKMKKFKIDKYTNTPFKKSRNLFGINVAKEYIRKEKKAILVEGNFDVITAHQYGLRNVVAISSSNLSKFQLSLASRYARDIYLLLDNDEAGQDGINRAINNYKNIANVSIKPLYIPKEYKDIDEFLQYKKVEEIYDQVV